MARNFRIGGCATRNEFDRRRLQDAWRRFCLCRKRDRHRRAVAAKEIKDRAREDFRYLRALTEL